MAIYALKSSAAKDALIKAFATAVLVEEQRVCVCSLYICFETAFKT